MAVAHARGIGFETEFRESTPVMTSMNLGAAKDLLLLYETLMDEEEQRDLLCQDQTLLNFLVYVLQETTDEIVMLSLKVLAALCADDNRCAIVSQTFGLSPSLELLTSGAQDFGVKEAALRLKMRLLEAKVALLARQQEEAAMADMRLSFRDSHSARKDGSFVATTPSPAKCPPFIGQHNGAAKVVSLHIEGLCSQSDRELCKEKLLAVRGVISFTFDIERRRCVVRVRSDLSARALIQAIKSTGTMSAMQVANSAIPKTPSNSKAKPNLHVDLRSLQLKTLTLRWAMRQKPVGRLRRMKRRKRKKLRTREKPSRPISPRWTVQSERTRLCGRRSRRAPQLPAGLDQLPHSSPSRCTGEHSFKLSDVAIFVDDTTKHSRTSMKTCPKSARCLLVSEFCGALLKRKKSRFEVVSPVPPGQYGFHFVWQPILA
ncbi:uncharacterized protein LOC142557078 isoform X1 [Dermacentor variabilis]|uniref:uncharacterized protein LOC142557078 isoform X1 n=1 Tax=Dermacentor variabilis TaxID=34621 RepID=UPI003F5BFBAB